MLFHFIHQPYVAIIGDIKNSKNLENRRAIQLRLEAVLESINQDCQGELASRFMITLGDEFQGLLKTGAAAIWSIDRIERAMHPIQLRFGIGVGDITTDINPDMPFGADGPAYHLARNMIDELKASEKRKMEPKVNTRIDIQGHAEISELLNAVFSLAMTIKEKWTHRQVEIMNAYLACDTQQDAARLLSINQSNVQKALAAANFYTYRKSIDAVAHVLSGIGTDREEDADV